MRLDEITWPEVDALDRERTVVVLPAGSTEQHGPHLPLGTDAMIAGAIVCETAGAGELVLPTITVGASAHHLPFTGSLAASTEGYLESVRAPVLSMARHGFRRFLVLNGHGGNTSFHDVALRGLKAEQPTLELAHADWWRLAGFEVGHACRVETSLMLYLRPELVRMDRARADGLTPEPPVHGLVWDWSAVTEVGVLGDPTGATAEEGSAILAAAVAALRREIEGLRSFAFVGRS